MWYTHYQEYYDIGGGSHMELFWYNIKAMDAAAYEEHCKNEQH